MKLETYAKSLLELAELYPDVDVVYSSDDEGNSFQKVVYSPKAGNFRMGTFILPDNKNKINSVCIN